MDDAFEDAKARFLEGVAHYEAGRYAAAAEAFEASLRAVPCRPSTLANLGAARLKLGRPADALAALDAALAAAPDDVDALSQRGVALAALGRHADALASHEQALGRDAGRVVDAFGRAAALATLGRADDAIAAYDATLRLAPTHAQAWSERGSVLREAGRLDEAAASYRQALAHGGDAALNGFFLASIDAAGAPPAPPLAYVERLFDAYAGEFGAHVTRDLGYRAHERLAQGAAEIAGLAGRRFRLGVDLGCGSGLCGRELCPLVVAAIDGVDVSARMLDEARGLGVYRTLVHADLAAWLETTGERYDLAAAADTFIYVGALERVFAGVGRVLDAAACSASRSSAAPTTKPAPPAGCSGRACATRTRRRHRGAGGALRLRRPAHRRGADPRRAAAAGGGPLLLFAQDVAAAGPQRTLRRSSGKTLPTLASR